MSTVAVFGCTGAVGSKILDTLLATDFFTSVKTISRRAPKTASSPKLDALIETDTSKWNPALAALHPTPSVVFNAVGTTRAAAGGIDNQWKIDHDLCIENARAAKEAGVKTYVYISSAGTRGFLSNMVPYSRMKVGVEDAIKELGFEQAIILRPKAILGEREVPKNAFFEGLMGNTGIQARTRSISVGPRFSLPTWRRRARPLPSIGYWRIPTSSRWAEMSGSSELSEH